MRVFTFNSGFTIAVQLLILLTSICPSSAQSNHFDYPPDSQSSKKIQNLQVHAGDSFNVTWETSYDRVSLGIRATAMGASNFTATQFVSPDLPGWGSYVYTLRLHDYAADSDAPINAYFVLTDERDPTQIVRSQNFTILQMAKNERYNPKNTDTPIGATTHTGSVTLFKSFGTVVASAATAPASASASTTGTGTQAPASAGTSVSAASPPQGLSPAAKAGIGIGAAIGILLMTAFGVAGFMLGRRKRREHQQQQQMQMAWPSQSTGPPHEPPWKVGELAAREKGTLSGVFGGVRVQEKEGQGLVEMGNDGQRVEMGAGKGGMGWGDDDDDGDGDYRHRGSSSGGNRGAVYELPARGSTPMGMADARRWNSAV